MRVESDAADIKVFKDVAPRPDGALHLRFRGDDAPALLNAIEILPAIAGHIRPIRILAQEGMYVDKQGRVWGGDRFFRGGNTVVRSTSVKNVPEPAIFRGERYGNFTYTIPVASGRYSITLHFAETWFGPRKSAGGGAGRRLFDVYCNGVALLKDFDIYKAAGGSDLVVGPHLQWVGSERAGQIRPFLRTSAKLCLHQRDRSRLTLSAGSGSLVIRVGHCSANVGLTLNRSSRTGTSASTKCALIGSDIGP